MQLGKKTAQETRVLRGLTFTIDWFGNRGRPDTFYDGFVYLLLLNDFSCTDQVRHSPDGWEVFSVPS